MPNGTSYTHQYNLEDHLGNNRISFYSNSGTASLLQEDEYYSFGLRKSLYDNSNNNRYLYNAKEVQTDLANNFDFGARFYDSFIGRWGSIDPLAEKYRRFSVYNYGGDNPIRFIDPDGMDLDDLQNGPPILGGPALSNGMSKVSDWFTKNILGFTREDAAKNALDLVDSKTTALQKIDAGVNIAQMMLSFPGENIENPAELPSVGDRALEIHSAVKPATQGRTTIAVADAVDADGNNVRIVGSNETRLRPEQRKVLQRGEIEAKGSGHAEVTVLNHAKNNGLTVKSIGASRPVCSNCAIAIDDLGLTPSTPVKFYKPIESLNQ